MAWGTSTLFTEPEIESSSAPESCSPERGKSTPSAYRMLLKSEHWASSQGSTAVCWSASKFKWIRETSNSLHNHIATATMHMAHGVVEASRGRVPLLDFGERSRAQCRLGQTGQTLECIYALLLRRLQLLCSTARR